MAIFTAESLETLRHRTDLVEVVSSQIEMKRAGTAYKGLCPFHDEKTPSFMIQKGDKHYHCFGCGAHGDAIQFLMDYNKMGFQDAVEHLAQRFGVVLDRAEERGDNKPRVDKAALRQVLKGAHQLFQFYLLHTEEGHQALQYLYGRGVDMEFIRRFELGLAPKGREQFFKPMQAQKFGEKYLQEAGLIAPSKSGGYRTFFYDRITFPIHDAMGNVIGFSARKYKEDTFGGKYVNTPETPLFKKSRVLYGLNYCRRRIAKEKRVLIVEGQLDTLRLIQQGFDITVAGQGTAFGEGHVKELLNLGVEQVYLALDADEAGQEASAKIGDLFQKEGVAVSVVEMPMGTDPDGFLMEEGPEAFQTLLEKAIDYLSFLVKHRGRYIDTKTPAGKNNLIRTISQQVRHWEQPVLVHESLRKLAELMGVPESVVGVDQQITPNLYTRHSGSVAAIGRLNVDPDRILEGDILRWIFLKQGDAEVLKSIFAQVSEDAFHNKLCRTLFQHFQATYSAGEQVDTLQLMALSDDPEMQVLVAELLNRKVNTDRWEGLLQNALQRLLDRNWMHQRQAIQQRLNDASCDEEEKLALVKQFGEISRNPPKVREFA